MLVFTVVYQSYYLNTVILELDTCAYLYTKLGMLIPHFTLTFFWFILHIKILVNPLLSTTS